MYILQKSLLIFLQTCTVCVSEQSVRVFFIGFEWFHIRLFDSLAVLYRYRYRVHTVEVKKTFPKTFRFDGQNGASVSVPFPFTGYRSVPVFRFPFSVPFAVWPFYTDGERFRVHRAHQYTCICALCTSLYVAAKFIEVQARRR